MYDQASNDVQLKTFENLIILKITKLLHRVLFLLFLIYSVLLLTAV